MSKEQPEPESAPPETQPAANAGHALVQIAERHGVDVIFGLVSIHNQPLVDAAEHLSRFVGMRHEAACVNAADAYARVKQSLGIAVTSTGTGAGNAAGSLVEALTAGSPVLHVTGQIDSEFLGQGRGVIHETKDQAAMLQAVSKAAITVVDSPVAEGSAAGHHLVQAAQTALTAPMGPVSVEIPIDLQYRPTIVPEPTTPALSPVPVLGTSQPPHATQLSPATTPPTKPAELVQPAKPADIATAVSLIAKAKRPALWLGGGATRARAEITALAETLNAAVFTSNAGRGIIDERDDRVVGNFAASPDGAELLSEADLLISIGTHFRSNETRHYKLSLPQPHIQIDVGPQAIGRAYPTDVGIIADASEAVSQLLNALTSEEPIAHDPRWTKRAKEAKTAARERLRAEIGPYAILCDAMREAMHDQSPFVRDVTIPASAWGNRLLPIYEPATNINARGGGIGQGLAMGIGAALARPHVPTFLMVGDGGIAVHLGELGTLAQEQPWLVVVLFNDGGYGVLRNLQDEHFDRRSGVDLITPDFATLASGYGIEHREIIKPDNCAQALQEAAALKQPVIIEVNCPTFGAMPKPFVPPVAVQ